MATQPAPSQPAPAAAPVGAAPSAAPPAILVDGVRKRFGDVQAVENISLSVPRGTILGLIGPSGSGKTTTVRMLTGAIAPDKGKVRVLGEDPAHFGPGTRERIGYQPQLFSLYPDLTAAENVDFVASLFGLLLFRRHRRVREVLEAVDLWEARKRRASDLSGGMQRRLELACALVHEPVVLFLDEPTAGLDPLLRGQVWDQLQRLKSAGRTLLVTTQYVHEAEECDNVALIARGRVIAVSTPDALRKEAMGGDVIEVETRDPFDAAVVANLPEVRDVRQTGPRTFRIVVADAATATPIVVAGIGQAGADVVASREYRPSFDDVFTTLVERDSSTAPTAGAAGADAAA
ncbi:MAG TPA: ABC transporter ATP-binding protein [Candidatus Limnocylindrales bacterium]|jgi:ABC-2 type transport system ATP-binding protein